MCLIYQFLLIGWLNLGTVYFSPMHFKNYHIYFKLNICLYYSIFWNKTSFSFSKRYSILSIQNNSDLLFSFLNLTFQISIQNDGLPGIIFIYLSILCSDSSPSHWVPLYAFSLVTFLPTNNPLFFLHFTWIILFCLSIYTPPLTSLLSTS